MNEPERPKRNLKQILQLTFLMGVRIIVNTLHRMVYPFLPEFSRAFGVSPVVFTNAIAARTLSGLASPALARLADSRGRKFGIGLGMILFTLGNAVIIIWPRFDVFVFGLWLAALGKYTIDPAVQAYIGDEVHPSQRGEAIAIVELGWSLSYLIGGVAVGRLLIVADWQAPFLMIGILSVFSLIGIFYAIPGGKRETGPKQRLWPRMLTILNNKSTRYGLLVGFFISGANELLSVTFGIWLESTFQLQLAALASAAFVIGLSELIGESLVGFITDSLGAKRAVLYGLLINCLIALLMPFIARSVTGAYISLFLFYFTFEFTLVSSISMMTILESESRATLMGLNISSLSFGRVAAAWAGLQLFNINFVVVIAAVIFLNILGVFSLGRVKLA